MKKQNHILLLLLVCVTNTLYLPLACGDKLKPNSSFSVDVNIPAFDEKKVQTVLVSSVGLVASTVALVLIGKGAIAHSTTPQPAAQKLDTATLFGYGVPLLAAGMLTIFHPQVIDYLNS
jgi:hypothetical protein